MSTVTLTADALPLVIPYRPARLTVATYHKLIETLELTENNRFELLKGVLVEKLTHNPLHSNLIRILQALLMPMLPQGFLFNSQLPITLSDSEPKPDISITRGNAAEFFTRHPGPADISLVIEVSSTSLLTDRYKAEIYAEAGIPWYWIVNLAARRVEVYSQPTPTADGLRYGAPQIYQPGELIPVIVDGRELGTLAAAELLPEISDS